MLSLATVAVDVFLVFVQVGLGLFDLLAVFFDLGPVGLDLGLAGVIFAVIGQLLLVLLVLLFLLLQVLFVLLDVLLIVLDIVVLCGPLCPRSTGGLRKSQWGKRQQCGQGQVKSGAHFFNLRWNSSSLELNAFQLNPR